MSSKSMNEVCRRLRNNDDLLSELYLIKDHVGCGNSTFSNDGEGSNSFINDNIAMEILSALKRNFTLKVLDICDTLISDLSLVQLSVLLSWSLYPPPSSLNSNNGSCHISLTAVNSKTNTSSETEIVVDKGDRNVNKYTKQGQQMQQQQQRGQDCHCGSSSNIAIQQLSLNHNKNITSIGITAVTMSLQYNTSLVTLDLSDNTQLGDGGLIALGLMLSSYNRTLKLLILSSCNITDIGFQSLLGLNSCLLVKELPTNDHFNCSSCGLEELVLDYNNITDEGMIALSDFLKQQCKDNTNTSKSLVLSSLKILSLNGNMITSTGICHLSEAMLCGIYCSIEEIYLEGNVNIGDDGCKSLFFGNHRSSSLSRQEKARRPLPFMKRLTTGKASHKENTIDLDQNQSYQRRRSNLGTTTKPSVAKESAIVVNNANQNNTKRTFLKTIDLSSCNISADAIATLVSSSSSLRLQESKAHQYHPTSYLQVLHLRNNTNIGDEGISLFSQIFSKNNMLCELYLWNVGMTAISVDAIFDSLLANGSKRKNKSIIPLKVLNIGANDIGNDGALIIANALQKSSFYYSLNQQQQQEGEQYPCLPIKSLNLAVCGIGMDGAIAMANMIESNILLEELFFHGNDIGDEGALAFAASLQCQLSLSKFKSLKLGRNNIGMLGLNAFRNQFDGTSSSGDDGRTRRGGDDTDFTCVINNSVVDLSYNDIGGEVWK